MRWSLALLLAALLLGAGCLTGASPDSTSPAPSDTDRDTDEVDPASDADEGSTTDGVQDPPSWIPGEYWTVEVDSTLLEEPVRWTRIVGGLTTEHYLIGQPAGEASPAALLLHVPGMGEVSFQNLSYDIHGETFTPVQFPLEDGTTWQTRFEGDPVNATASVQRDVVHIEYCCSRNITAVYDPDVRGISEMDVDDGFLSYEVLDHGFAFDGAVEIPAQRELLFMEGQVAGALGASGGVGPPVGQAEVPEEVDRVAFTQIVGNAGLGSPVETGVYLERATLPNGTTYTTEQAASTDGLAVSFHDVGNASGTWRFDHVAAGPGMAFTEGIGYQLETRVLR